MSVNPTNYSEWTDTKAPDPCEVLSHPYPFTTYHEMSLGWFLEQWKEFLKNYEESKEAISGITADAETVPYTEPATVIVTGGKDGAPYHLHFKIPQGKPGHSADGNVKSVNHLTPDESGNITLTPNDVGALPTSGGSMTGEISMNGQIISGLYDPTEDSQAARKGYVDIAVKKAYAWNILDNSDFLNPVNQRGFTSTSQETPDYGLDRWEIGAINNGSATISVDGLVCVNAVLTQKIDAKLIKSDKTYTMAVYYADGSRKVATYWVDIEFTPGVNRVVFYNTSGTIIGLTLYEGSYTAETLPNYNPKGYGVELSECQRYYQIRSTNNIAAVDMQPTMRLTNPTITSVPGGYAYSADY